MKVTKREQMLLGALLIVLLGYCFYNFVYTKQNQKITELKASRDKYNQKWEQVKAKIASKDKNNEQYKILNAKIVSKTDKLFPSIVQEEIIVILDRMLEDSKLQGDILGFSEVSIDNTAESTSKSENSNANNEEKNGDNELEKLVSDFNSNDKKESNAEKTNNSKVVENNTNTNNVTTNSKNDNTKTDNSKAIGAYKMQVTLNFKGKYEELISFIKQVEIYDKKIIISSINLGGEEGSDVSGNLILEFYGVPRLNNNDDFKWDYKKPSGKDNPFVGANISIDSIKTPEVKKLSSYDFEMTVKPSSSDLPTVILGKSKDRNRNTYVYGDNNGIEDVEICFMENNGKYFYKYKTASFAYPQNYNSMGEEFSVSGNNIYLAIYSIMRNSQQDLSGVNLKIINETSKGVFVKIQDDDKTRPRINITPLKGVIKQER